MINDFRIGADPEFIMADKDALLHMWPDDDEEIVTEAGVVGPDHGGYVAELRPKPAMGSYGLVRRIKTLLTAPDWGNHRNYRWLAGPVQTVQAPAEDGGCDCCCRQHCACDYDWDERHEELVQPLGGHIHLDIKGNDPRWDAVVDALDEQHRFFENLELYPKDDCDTRRVEGYGKHRWVTANSAGGDDDHGDRYEKADLDRHVAQGYTNAERYHMEFRTPPSWLYHPRLAMLSLTSAKLAAADPAGTIEALRDKPIALNTLRDWYERYRGKDENATRVLDNILHGKRVSQLQFDTSVDLKDVWQTIDF
jgi:hypothetical protein